MGKGRRNKKVGFFFFFGKAFILSIQMQFRKPLVTEYLHTPLFFFKGCRTNSSLKKSYTEASL